jgi:hypothetical protein
MVSNAVVLARWYLKVISREKKVEIDRLSNAAVSFRFGQKEQMNIIHLIPSQRFGRSQLASWRIPMDVVQGKPS